MKIVVATDSFKGSLTAGRACRIIADAVRGCVPEAQLIIKPMADGGEGTAEALMQAAAGNWIPHTVTGPLPDMKVPAGFVLFDDGTALVEMATASGLTLLTRRQLNPTMTTTYGTGELVKAAADFGARKILLAIGGSATVDAGVGAAMALGWQFLDTHNRQVPLGGRGLSEIKKIVRPVKLALPPVEVLCDVDNPLCGEHGAAIVYGPQKGATPDMVAHLEGGLAHLARLVREQLGPNIKDIPRAGAAGGLAAGAIAFMNGVLVSGIETVMARSGLAEALRGADWVVTGEGSFDAQSLRGKVVSGVCRLARGSGVRAAVIAGSVGLTEQEYREHGVAACLACRKEDMTLDYAIENAEPLLTQAAQRFAAQWLMR